MFRSVSCVLLLCIWGFGGSSCHAAIIESNDPRYPGTANTTIDTATNLEWLDWTAAKTPPPIPDFDWDIDSHLKPGGLYEGWRLANYADVERLMHDVGLGMPSVSGAFLQSWTADWDPIPLSALDPFVYRGPAPKTASRSNRDYEMCLGDKLRFTVKGWVESGRPGYFTATGIDHLFNLEQPYCGHAYGYMLVRTAHPVPEPNGLATLWVVAPALVRCVRKRRSIRETCRHG